MNIFYGYLFSYSYIIALLVIVTAIKKISNIQNNDIFRKSIHIMVSFTWIILCEFLYGTWHFVAIPISFIFITAVFAKYKLVKILERSGGMGEGERKDYGIVHYAVSMTIICIVALLCPTLLIPCGIGIFALSFGDGAAAVLGQCIKKGNFCVFETKTIVGMLACFAFSIVGIFLLKMFFSFSIGGMALVVVGVTAALMELIGGRVDNYTVPLGVIVVSALMQISEV
jgi:dolichol kinase